jgi:hypothetical protein
LPLHEAFHPLVHRMLRFEHPGQACHERFMLAEALFVVVRHRTS